jgi:uncharacterized DUF497 family protein
VEIVALWDEHNIAHVARHAVTPSEVEEVLAGADTLAQTDDSHRPGRLLVWGRTTAGRYLLAVLDPPNPSGTAYVVTARPMTAKERTSYQEAL